MNRNVVFASLIAVLLAFIGGYTYYKINEKSPERIYTKNKKAVVFISAYDFGGNPVKFGSGFIIDKSGVIATNYHVINDSADIVIKTLDDRVLMVEAIKYYDEVNDLALLKIKKSNEYDLPVVYLGDSDKLDIGEKVYVIGNPKGLESTFSEGNVSGMRVRGGDSKVIQITAPVSHGSSGGPVLDRNGHAVGIATFIIADGQNLNFAVPINKISKIISVQQNTYTLPSQQPKLVLIESEPVYASSGLTPMSWLETFIDADSIMSVADNIKGAWLMRATRSGESLANYSNLNGGSQGRDGKANRLLPSQYAYAHFDCLNQTISVIFDYDVDGQGRIIKSRKETKKYTMKTLGHDELNKLSKILVSVCSS